MKKITAILLAFSLCILSAGCASEGDTSSVADVASVPQKQGGLYYENSNVTSTVSKANTATQSNTDNSQTASSKGENGVQDYSFASVPPSELNNPTGLVSVDRTDNNGDDWTKALVNPWNTLHKGYTVQLAQVDSRFATDKEFDARAVEYLNSMCEAALADGITLTVISAYRSYDYQQMLFDNQIASVKAQNPALSDEEAEKEAATVVARPGTSEHNLGLAVDIDSVEETFENTEAFAWLQEHCTEYGFIMRYSREKQDVTGIIYEPWHYRYVGKDLAKQITDSGLCLEEWLKQSGQ